MMYSEAVRTLRNIRSDAAELEHSSTEAAVLMLPLSAAVTSLAWLATPEAGWGRALVTVAGLAAMAGLIWASRARRVIRPLPASGGLLQPLTLADADEAPYRVVLEQQTGKTQLLLEHSDPAVVVRDMRRILASSSLNVSAAWGLPAERFRQPPAARDVELTPGNFVGRRWGGQAAVTQAVFGSAGFVLLVFIWSVLTEKPQLHWLSVALPLLSVASLLLVGSWLLSLRVHVTLAATHLLVQEVAWGRSRRLLFVRAEELLAMDSVSHTGRPATHVLVETAAGVHAFPLTAEATLALLEHVRWCSGAATGRSTGHVVSEPLLARLNGRLDEGADATTLDGRRAKLDGLGAGNARGGES
ncbi:MAG TPA: hypothetical protein VER33_20030 [Polyangiaceae bacterium]|nr:hypothetical protein [Polyangiaceae bacterium]